MVVHPSPGHPNGTLVNAVLNHCGLPALELQPGQRMPDALSNWPGVSSISNWFGLPPLSNRPNALSNWSSPSLLSNWPDALSNWPGLSLLLN